MRISRDTLRGFLGIILALSIIGCIHLLRPAVSAAPDFNCSGERNEVASIDVKSGETGSEIARELFQKGVTASYESFFRVAVGDSRSSRIAPGIHRIDKKICATQALEQLLDSKRIANLIVVSEGAWNYEIKKSLLAVGFSNSEISKAFSSVKLPAGFRTLEGLLFPAQYSFERTTPLVDILSAIIDRGAQELARSGISAGSDKFSPQQLLTIASLVQAEGDEKDFAKISQVVRNRLSVGMPLQFDSTVHYVKGSRGAVFLSTQSTFLSSPYNTYRHYGLPPGPINNPGAKAMFAATHPQAGDWLYFVTVAPGDTRFTSSISEFNDWKVLYKKNLKSGKFGVK